MQNKIREGYICRTCGCFLQILITYSRSSVPKFKNKNKKNKKNGNIKIRGHEDECG
jgi:hypothetical protein